jgi:imidazolonepropionase-like amidohydrolase
MRKMNRYLLILGTLFLLPIIASPNQTYVIKAGRLIDGQSAEIRRDVIIVVQGNKIVALGEHADTPKGAVLLDLSDKTVLPGFIDAHTHIMVDGVDDYGADLYKNSTPFRAIRAVASVRKALWNGFTGCGI